VPKAEFDQYGAQVVNAAAIGMATIFETLAKQPYVVGVQWGQQSHAGQLQDVAIVSVASTSGNSQTTYTVPVTQLGPKLNATQIKRVHDQLDDTERL
jgi:hypothetical protein